MVVRDGLVRTPVFSVRLPTVDLLERVCAELLVVGCPVATDVLLAGLLKVA
jgi:hypothetical protein